MALFFDQDWFDARLADIGKTRRDLARHLGLTREEVEEIWKDQREILAHEVAMIAAFLDVDAKEVVKRAGVATPAPQAQPAIKGGEAHSPEVLRRLDELNGRILRLERLVMELKTLILNPPGRDSETDS